MAIDIRAPEFIDSISAALTLTNVKLIKMTFANSSAEPGLSDRRLNLQTDSEGNGRAGIVLAPTLAGQRQA